MVTPQKYFNVREVAALLGYNPETIRERCRIGPNHGGLRAVKGCARNSPWRIPESAIA